MRLKEVDPYSIAMPRYEVILRSQHYAALRFLMPQLAKRYLDAKRDDVPLMLTGAEVDQLSFVGSLLRKRAEEAFPPPFNEREFDPGKAETEQALDCAIHYAARETADAIVLAAADARAREQGFYERYGISDSVAPIADLRQASALIERS